MEGRDEAEVDMDAWMERQGGLVKVADAERSMAEAMVRSTDEAARAAAGDMERIAAETEERLGAAARAGRRKRVPHHVAPGLAARGEGRAEGGDGGGREGSCRRPPGGRYGLSAAHCTLAAGLILPAGPPHGRAPSAPASAMQRRCGRHAVDAIIMHGSNSIKSIP